MEIKKRALRLVIAFMAVFSANLVWTSFFSQLSPFLFINIQVVLLAGIGWVVLELYRCIAETRQELDALKSVHESYLRLAAMAQANPDEDELLQELLKQAVKLIEPAQKGTLSMLQKNGHLHFRCAVGFDINTLHEVSLRLEDTFLAKITSNKLDRTVIVPDMNRFNREEGLDKRDRHLLRFAAPDAIQSTLSSPIYVAGKLHGTFNLDSVKANVFNEKDVKIAEMYSFIAGNIIGLHQNQKALKDLADLDVLTGCYNRQYLDANVDSWRETFGESRIAMVDMDNLKWINDNLGHVMGDEAIEIFASLLKSHVKPDDIVARVGGDEFVVLTTMDSQQVESCFNQLNHHLNRVRGVLEGRLGFSFGYCDLTGDWSKVLGKADRIMYQAKRSKKLAMRLKEEGADTGQHAPSVNT